jgi:hypothetical protein
VLVYVWCKACGSLQQCNDVNASVSADLQYAAAVHGEKLKRVWHRAANRDRPVGHTIGKQFFNPRLVPEEVTPWLCRDSMLAVACGQLAW